ncbi:zinc finger protein a20 domain-containing [Stylonychia lemnae]|uniref:Zinc finger protein a20 domain-containing n=1 Tax=Stylonychia lemnae TaxID=5949 RepID=A0A078ACP4_STYLE|nr:zinc finger protein a20 domain-containing [Stylonychia lemnae]|eukprot:CDW79954.1 zinc finger protein a20 domain-containing [Stylonychia lemnae]
MESNQQQNDDKTNSNENQPEQQNDLQSVTSETTQQTEQQQQTQSVPIVDPNERRLCSGCHQFYGTAATNFMCSVCFKKAGGILSQTQPQKKEEVQPQTFAQQNDPSKEEQKAPERPIQDKTRCWSCKKKVGLTGVQCRCEYTFCSKHRYPEEHSCDFDFNNFYKKKLENENQKLAHKKIDKLY